MEELIAIAERIGARLKQRGDTIAVAKSSTGGLISAALLAVPGASAYFIGGGVIYTGKARAALLGLRAPVCPTACDPPPSRTLRCWRAPCARPAAPPGDWRKPARQVPPATATATPPGIAASRSPVRRNMPLRSKRGNGIGRRICTPSPLGHWRSWRRQCNFDPTSHMPALD